MIGELVDSEPEFEIYMVHHVNERLGARPCYCTVDVAPPGPLVLQRRAAEPVVFSPAETELNPVGVSGSASSWLRLERLRAMWVPLHAKYTLRDICFVINCS